MSYDIFLSFVFILWGSEYLTCLVIEGWIVGQLLNGLVLNGMENYSRNGTKNPLLGLFWFSKNWAFFWYLDFFAERGYNLLTEYYDSIKGRLSDSYSVTGQVWMLFVDLKSRNSL